MNAHLTQWPNLPSTKPTSAIGLGLLLLLSGPLAAEEKEAPPHGTVKLTVVGTLSAKRIMPVVYAYDGRCLLYFTELKGGLFDYWQADADGADPRRIFRIPVASDSWDDYLNPMTGPSFSSKDGRVAVLTTRNNQPEDRDQNRMRVGVLHADGQLTKIDSELGQITGFGFAGDELIYLDSGGHPGTNGKGYKLKAWDGKETRTLLHSENGLAMVLHVSPTNQHAAFFEISQPELKFRLRVVDLKKKQTSDSDWFLSSDFTFDGAPIFHWSANGKDLFYPQYSADSADSAEGIKRGEDAFSLMRFDPQTRTSHKLPGADNTAVVAVLDEDHLAVQNGILRISDGKLFALRGRALGGHAHYIAYVNYETFKLEIARFELIE